MSTVCNQCQHCPHYPYAMNGSDSRSYSWSGICAKKIRVMAHNHTPLEWVIITPPEDMTICPHYTQKPRPFNRFYLILAGTTVPEDLG